jgi:hypothetical protein
MSFLAPKNKKIRDPISNVIDNGLIVNPPRFAEIGGLSGRNTTVKKNKMTIRKPGASINK